MSNYGEGCFDYGGIKSQLNPSIVVIENIHQKIAEIILSNGNRLEMTTWHLCNTTHCRAGWVTFLAGDSGKQLEQRFGMPLAASIIYNNSSQIKVPWHRFFDLDNKRSMSDILRCSQEEKLVDSKH